MVERIADSVPKRLHLEFEISRIDHWGLQETGRYPKTTCNTSRSRHESDIFASKLEVPLGKR
jgi:hypothetical protein